MKAQAELNALLLQAKNYERLKGIKVRIIRDHQMIQIEEVPKPLIDHFAEKIGELVEAEREKAVEFVETAAFNFAAAAAIA